MRSTAPCKSSRKLVGRVGELTETFILNLEDRHTARVSGGCDGAFDPGDLHHNRAKLQAARDRRG